MAPTALQQALGATQLDIGKLFGVGGSAWTVTDAEGGDRGTVTLYVRRVNERRPAPTGDGWVTATDWIARGPLASLAADMDTDGVCEGRTIQSVTDASYAFQVVSPADTTRGIVSFVGLERIRGDS